MATRQQIAGAARRLFAERGYLGTTIAAIAAEADIPAPTIYSAFGTKAKILEEITRLWIAESGTRQEHEESIRQPDPVRRLQIAAHWHTRQMELGYDVITIYQEAARADPEMALVLKSVLDGREPTPYRHSYAGSVASLGLHKGVAQVYGVKLKGWPAWAMHRAYHVSRVPTLNRKVRVIADWTAALLFRREVVSLGQLQSPRYEFEEASGKRRLPEID